jgi:hypothetical protein
MSDVLTSNSLVSSIKRRAHVPENQSTFNFNDFLEFANEELRLALVPSLMSLNEDFLLFEQEVDLVPNKNEYTIPSRAVGNKLRDVQKKFVEGSYGEMTRISIGERFADSNDGYSQNSLSTFYVKNNKVVLQGSNSYTGKLVFIYYIKPSRLVAENRIGVIKGINRATGEIVLDKIPSVFNTNAKYDLYKSDSPNSILKIDLSLASINTSTLTVIFNASEISEEVQIGDHVSLAGECIIPQVPSDIHPMLAQLVACRVLESQGDTEGLQNALLKLKQMQDASGIILDNRVEEAPQKIVNRHGTMRSAVFSKRYNRR